MINVIEMYQENLLNKGNSELTIKNEISAVNGFVKWYKEWNYMPIETPMEEIVDEVSVKDIREWKDFKQGKMKKPHMKQAKVASEASLNKTLQRLKRFFEFTVEKGFSVENPAEKHKAVTVAQVAPKSLKPEEKQELVRRVKKMYVGSHLAKKNYRNYAIIMTLLHTGLRIKELCDLKEQNLITVKDGKETKYYFDFYGKGGQRRRVKLNNEARDIFLDYRKEHQVSGEYLFDSERSEQLTTRAIQHVIAEICDELSFRFTAHQLRHTCIKDLVDAAAKNGVPLELIGRVAGHFKKDGTVNLAQTMRYAMSTAEEAADVTDILSSY